MGEWERQPETEVELHGAIIAHRESKTFRSEGTITAQDRALYMLEPLQEALKGAKIIHGNKAYSVDSELTNAEFTGVWAYNLKYVSAFNGGGGSSD